jgi:DNA-binding PadR family transcriptional regulator
MKTVTLLGYALLGLLHGKPASGYDLRKTFTDTPMGRFSDSPGAIYPALRGLEERKLLGARSKSGPGLRGRRELKLTAAGSAELVRWLSSPVGQPDVARGMGDLMLRFAFMDTVLGEAATLTFLHAFDQALRAHVPALRKYLKVHSSQMPRSGRLALESGICGYEAQARWVVRAIRTYEEKGHSK